MAIDDRGPHWEVMEPRFRKADALLGGTEAMRKEGQTYLPPFPAESDDNYERRLNCATLTNLYRRSVDTMVGTMFREEMTFREETGLDQEILSDIDRKGTSLQGLGEGIASKILTHGVQAIMVDFPPNEGEITLQQERSLGLRHYAWCPDPSDIIELQERSKGGVREVVYVSWFERGHIRNAMGKLEEANHVRVWALEEPDEDDPDAPSQPRVRWELHDPIASASTQKRKDKLPGGYVLKESGYIEGVQSVPCVTAYAPTPDDGAFCRIPPLQDIAEKTIRHWQLDSSQDNILELTAFPEKVIKVDNPEEFIQQLQRDEASAQAVLGVGPHMARIIQRDDSYEYIGAPMTGIQERAEQLNRIVRDVELMGVQLIKTNGQRTATEAESDNVAAMAPLQRVALEVEKALNRVLAIITAWRGQNEEPGRVMINKDFAVTADEALEWTIIREARALGDLSAETALMAAKKLAPSLANMDVAEELARRENPDDFGA